jgi:DNA-binding Xre family transcriptional regulator
MSPTSGSPIDYTPQLQHLMQLRGISTFKALSQQTGVSGQHLLTLRRGQILALRLETLAPLSRVLQVSIADLLVTFLPPDLAAPPPAPPSLEQEYQRLQQQLAQQHQQLWQEFQQTSLQTLEPWLLQWSAAAYAAQQNPQLSAVKLLPLLRPIEQLLQQWDIVTFVTVGTEIPYDPQWHQLISGIAAPGTLVRVRYAGYRQGEKLLHRAKVSPV